MKYHLKKVFNKKTITNQRTKNKLKNILQVGLALFFVGYFFDRLDYWSIKKWDSTLDKILFFASSDFFEYGVTTFLSVLSYRFISKKTSLQKTIWGVLLFVILYSIATIKSLRIAFNIFEQNEDLAVFFSEHYGIILSKAVLYLFNYIGVGVTIFGVFVLIDRIDVIFDNHYQKTLAKFKKAQAQLLQRQLNPHFLYNAFNSLYSLSLQKNPQTPEAILTLSNMMRYITDNSGHRVALEKELAFIEQYMGIEKMRFASKDRIKIITKGDVSTHFIEPLLLITLVENAFKHGFYNNDPNAFVTVSTACEKTNIVFKVENSVQKTTQTPEKTREGKGIEILKKRLKLSYPKKHKLTLSEKDGIFTAVLVLK